MTAVQEKVETLNRLLRGELSALETYEQVLEKGGDESDVVMLRDIARQHDHAVELLREHIIRFGGEPETSSGVWGAWAKAVMGTAKLFGNQAAWQALREGEEHGVREYEAALRDENLPEECRDLIVTRLLPTQRRHSRTLRSLQKTHCSWC